MTGRDRAAQRGQQPGHGIGQRLRAAPRERPADLVRGQREHQRYAPGGRRGQRRGHMRRQPGQQAARVLAAEGPGQHGRRGPGEQPEVAHQQGMRRQAGQRRAQQVHGQVVPPAAERPHELEVGLPVDAERRRGFGDRAGQHGGGSVRERVGDRQVRLDPGQPVPFERPGPQGRGSRPERVDGRAGVVPEARQGQFLGPGPAADGVRTLVHHDAQAGLGQRDRRGQPVRPRAHHDRIEIRHAPTIRCRWPAVGSGSPWLPAPGPGHAPGRPTGHRGAGGPVPRASRPPRRGACGPAPTGPRARPGWPARM